MDDRATSSCDVMAPMTRTSPSSRIPRRDPIRPRSTMTSGAANRSFEQGLVGVAVDASAIAAAVADIADGTRPPSDLNGDGDYRRHLAPILARRAVLAAAG